MGGLDAAESGREELSCSSVLKVITKIIATASASFATVMSPKPTVLSTTYTKYVAQRYLIV